MVMKARQAFGDYSSGDFVEIHEWLHEAVMNSEDTFVPLFLTRFFLTLNLIGVFRLSS